MLIAEDLLLLCTDDRSGQTRNSTGALDYALAGAVLCDLELLGRIRLTSPGEPEHRKNRVIAVDVAPTGDPVRDAALRSLMARDCSPQRAVRIVKKGLRKTLYARLVDAGVVGQDHLRLLGVFPVTRHPIVLPMSVEDVRAAVNHAFLVGTNVDRRTSALIACLAVAGRVKDVVPEVHPMLTKRAIRTRSRGYLDAHWAAKAARSTYQADASGRAGWGLRDSAAALTLCPSRFRIQPHRRPR